ncbi:MAG: hypothetical protein PHC70_01400 [Patescibacteria group bacterium]|nr:hypothetical protein [Patescibacteria group bacterium]
MKRYFPLIYIPVLKWLANVTIVMIVFGYLFPNPLNKWLELGIGWTLSMGIAMFFAYWACHKEVPQGKQLGLLILFWAVITALMEMLLSYYTFWDPFFTLLNYAFAVQLLLEILGILIIVKVLRRQRAYNVAAEGINLEA